MPFSSGTFSRIYNWVNEQLSSPIEISKLDAQEEDFATALNNCVLRDGTGLPTAAMDWNGQNLTNVAAFTATGIVTGGRFVPTSSSVPTNGMYLSAANTVGIASNTTLRASVNSTGNWTIAAPSSGTTVAITGRTGGSPLDILQSASGAGTEFGWTVTNGTDSNIQLVINQVGAASKFAQFQTTVASAMNFATNSTTRLVIGSAGNVTINAPSSGNAVTISGVSGGSTLNLVNTAGSVRSITYGNGTIDGYLAFTAGNVVQFGNSTAHQFSVMTNNAARIDVAAAGNVTINAPSSGTGLTIGGGGADITGTVTATTFSGSGASLTALNASNLSSGTVPDARFPATLPAASGVNLTALNASNLASGTVPDARFPATLPAASGANLTALNASNLSSGTVATGRISGSYTGITAIGNATALDDAAAAQTLGWRDMPQNASSSVTLALSDRGKHVYASGTTSTVAIPANGSVAFPVGSTIVLVNDGTGNMTVSITTDTLAWLTGGTESTGTRTVATKSVVTLVKVTSTRWIITGAGIS